MADASAWQRFRQWRRRRPFWGGLLLILSALALFLSANLTLADLEVHFGQEGFLSYLLPVVLLLCGLLIWYTPAQRLFYAVIGLVTALYSLVGLNLGGFGVGMVLGIVGGALAFAWTPAAPPPSPSPSSPPSLEDDRAGGDRSAGDPLPAADPAPADGPAPPDHPGLDDRAPHRGVHRKLFLILLIPLLVTASVLVAGSRAPARADDDCPEGLPSRTAAAAPSGSRTRAPARKPARRPKPAPEPSASAGPPADADDRTGNPIVDGWHDLVEGIGDLFGRGREETPPPSPSPSATSARATPKPAPPAKTPPRTPSATPSLPPVPCLGPRVFKEAGPDDIPLVSARPGLMEGDSLTMFDSTYDGVVEIQTATGPLRVLKFSMRKSVTEPFSLTIPERGGRSTLITSDALTVEGNVRFYTPRFTGKLFGLIPVTFTPEAPPPLTLPVLKFTDIRIDLAFVRSDVLTADPLDVRERR